MKLLIALSVLLLLTFNLTLKPTSTDIATRTALNLFTSINCSDSAHFNLPIGTGFPVSHHLVMTAAHVDCGEGITTISHDNKTFMIVTHENIFNNANVDVALFYVPYADYRNLASFRTATLGEKVVNYGIPFENILESGYVMQNALNYITITNLPIGGLSGSAIVASNGDVVGLTDLGSPTYVGEHFSGSITMGIPAETLKQALQSFLKQFPDKK